MNPIFTGIICALISFVIAAITIGREARRLDSFSPVPVYIVEEAVAFVADLLPEEVSARVSFWDVRRILDMSREDHDAYGLSSESMIVRGPQHVVNDLVVVSEDRDERIARRAAAELADLSGSDVRLVLRAELSYLESIGAVGPQANEAR
jgi:hypothetical protein